MRNFVGALAVQVVLVWLVGSSAMADEPISWTTGRGLCWSTRRMSRGFSS